MQNQKQLINAKLKSRFSAELRQADSEVQTVRELKHRRRTDNATAKRARSRAERRGEVTPEERILPQAHQERGVHCDLWISAIGENEVIQEQVRRHQLAPEEAIC